MNSTLHWSIQSQASMSRSRILICPMSLHWNLCTQCLQILCREIHHLNKWMDFILSSALLKTQKSLSLSIETYCYFESSWLADSFIFFFLLPPFIYNRIQLLIRILQILYPHEHWEYLFALLMKRQSLLKHIHPQLTFGRIYSDFEISWRLSEG